MHLLRFFINVRERNPGLSLANIFQTTKRFLIELVYLSINTNPIDYVFLVANKGVNRLSVVSVNVGVN